MLSSETVKLANFNPKENIPRGPIDLRASAEDLTREIQELKKSQELNNNNLGKRINIVFCE